MYKFEGAEVLYTFKLSLIFHISKQATTWLSTSGVLETLYMQTKGLQDLLVVHEVASGTFFIRRCRLLNLHVLHAVLITLLCAVV